MSPRFGKISKLQRRVFETFEATNVMKCLVRRKDMQKDIQT